MAGRTDVSMYIFGQRLESDYSSQKDEKTEANRKKVEERLREGSIHSDRCGTAGFKL